MNKIVPQLMSNSESLAIFRVHRGNIYIERPIVFYYHGITINTYISLLIYNSTQFINHA